MISTWDCHIYIIIYIYILGGGDIWTWLLFLFLGGGGYLDLVVVSFLGGGGFPSSASISVYYWTHAALYSKVQSHVSMNTTGIYSSYLQGSPNPSSGNLGCKDICLVWRLHGASGQLLPYPCEGRQMRGKWHKGGPVI